MKNQRSLAACGAALALLLVAGGAAAVQFTGIQTAASEWTYTLTFDYEDNYSQCQSSTTITLSGLFGVTQAVAPTSTDYTNPFGASQVVLWTPQVSPDGTTVTWTSAGDGTGDYNYQLHVFGFKVIAPGAWGGTATVVTSGFAEDAACPSRSLDIRAAIAGPVLPVIPSPGVWVPVVSHTSGKNNSQWRSDLGLLNLGAATAGVQGTFYGSGGAVSGTFSVPAGAQVIVTDVVGILGGSGSGALQITSGQPLEVTARTYNQVAAGASCYAGGTQGQDYPAVATGGGLGAGQSAYLAGLTEDPSYRSNIGVVNTDTVSATVLVTLYGATGGALAQYTVSLTPGQWSQTTQPFLNLAGQTAMESGYATVTVQSGSGVFAFASVIDNITNDPTTVAMQR